MGAFTPSCQGVLFNSLDDFFLLLKALSSCELFLFPPPSECHPDLSCSFFYFLHRPAPVVPAKRKWCHVTTTATRGTIGVPGSDETSVRLASTMEEPTTAVPPPLSMATTVRGSFPSRSFPPSSPPQSRLPWQHRVVTSRSSEASREQDPWLRRQPR